MNGKEVWEKVKPLLIAAALQGTYMILEGITRIVVSEISKGKPPVTTFVPCNCGSGSSAGNPCANTPSQTC